MRYYLDTNILVFILTKKKDDISSNITEILTDYANVLYTSSVAVKELVLLYRIGKLEKLRYISEQDMLNELKDFGIETIFFNEHHFAKYTQLDIIERHRDMNDHAIIAQAISDKISLISSDTAFKHYTTQGLNLVFNRR
ncbi:MAG: PIN domain-containing protein [Candidatus Symbiothrix sp.]|jgi:PIN domain nuclease of toxin-antitoxin system|nr:PIN domain-containing protein [Candidatus Symbiothrix sp.]